MPRHPLLQRQFDRFYEDMVRLRKGDPEQFARIVRQVRRRIARREGRRAAEEHMAYVEGQLDAAGRRRVARPQAPADPERLDRRLAASQEAMEDAGPGDC